MAWHDLVSAQTSNVKPGSGQMRPRVGHFQQQRMHRYGIKATQAVSLIQQVTACMTQFSDVELLGEFYREYPRLSITNVLDWLATLPHRCRAQPL